MSGTFENWNERIAAANDELERRKLIGELGMWRASHLTDIAAMRSSAFAMSRLYMLVGDRPSAVREAESLYSLCRTAPEATKDELKRVKAYLRSLGLQVTEKGEITERKKRDKKDAKAVVVERIRAGDTRGAAKLLRGRKKDHLRPCFGCG